MDRYNVTGMSCAACQAHVEKAVSKVPGVESVSVSLLTNSMGVEGNADAEDIIKAVEDAGYGASPENSAGNTRSGTGLLEAQEKALEDTESPVLRRRLISSVVFSCSCIFRWDTPCSTCRCQASLKVITSVSRLYRCCWRL